MQMAKLVILETILGCICIPLVIASRQKTNLGGGLHVESLKNNCSSIVAGGKVRNTAQSQKLPCKCGTKEVIVGKRPECSKFLDQRYFPMSLPPHACSCERPSLCEKGIFLTVVRQPSLNLLHIPLSVREPFARIDRPNKHSIIYRLSCERDVPVVVSESLDSKKKSVVKVKKTWEICRSKNAADGEVHLLLPAVDLVWGTETASDTFVDGCIRIESATKWKQFADVRGNLEQQQLALAAHKKEVGGCPQFRSKNDRITRASDFGKLSWWLGKVQGWQHSRAKKLATGSSYFEKVGNLFMFAFMKVGVKMNRTLAFKSMAEVNCAEPAPFGDGIMKFHYNDILRVAQDPLQPRAFATAATAQTENCFHPTLPLFQSAGSPEHTQVRKLLDEAIFEDLELENLSRVDESFLDTIEDKHKTKNGVPSNKEIGTLVLPLIMQAIWQKEASKTDVQEMLPYLTKGASCIFGKIAENLKVFKPMQINSIRDKMTAFAKNSPRAKVLGSLLKKYQVVKHHYALNGPDPSETLLRNVGDMLLFAGFLGTTDMATKCVAYQWRDQAHVRMYRNDKTAYLHELMRYDAAVTSFTTPLKAKEHVRLEGFSTTLPEGTLVQLSLGAANRDPKVFKEPSKFDPQRLDISEQISWNGRLEDVIARNYSGAPRFCPGYHLSVKVATLICDHFTKHLEA